MTRQILLTDIANRLFNDDSPETAVLLAMGGAGKTQLALEVCRQAEQSRIFAAVIWIDASSLQSVIRSYKSIAQRILKQKAYNLDDEGTICLQVQDELRGWDQQWLMVFDNYDNPRAFHGHSIRDYLPSGRSGRILFTSRHQDSARLGHKIDVSTMTENESLQLLLQRPPLNEAESMHARKIVSTLGHLALAIDQAGAYVRARSLDLKDFIQHYHDRKEVVLQEIPDEWEYSRAIDDEQMETRLRILTTWELSFKQISGQEREVQDKEHFLTLAAFFHAGNVSERYLQAYFDRSSPDWMRIFSSSERWDSYKLGDVLSEFQKLSLLQTQNRTNECHYISIHPVICDWIRCRRSLSLQKEFAAEMTKALTDYLEDIDVDLLSLEMRLEIVRHIDSCISSDRKLPQNSSQVSDSLPRSLSLFAEIYCNLGQYNKAEGLYRRVLLVSEGKLGAPDLSNLGIKQDLGNVLFRQGRYDEAESLYKDLLIQWETRLGKMHVVTLRAVMDLGRSCYRKGRFDEAESLMKRIAKGREESLGLTHSDTLESLECLACVHLKQGRYDEAETLYERALSGFQEKLGETHPDTLNAMQNLAVNYNHQGRYDEAKELFQRTLNGRIETLGARHQLRYTQCTF